MLPFYGGGEQEDDMIQCVEGRKEGEKGKKGISNDVFFASSYYNGFKCGII